MVQATMYYEYAGLVLNGRNYKRNDIPREWCNAIATGNYFSSKYGDMIQVKEIVNGKKQTRWVNMSTFTGTFGPFIYRNGVRTDGRWSTGPLQRKNSA